MVEKLLQHRHCRECGKAISSDERYCDAECKETYIKEQRRKLTYYLLLVIIGGVVIAFTMIMG